MPNPQNIHRPITMISHGRSGTSLAMNILGQHPDVLACGETAPMLFGTWHAMEKERGIIRPDPERPPGDHDARCAKAVRAVFLATFPDGDSAAAEWMHKPINIPWVMNHLPGLKDWDEKAGWYWRVLHGSFPGSRNITILRHPYDVVLSAAEYWGAPHGKTWEQLVRMARVLIHPESDVGLGLSHARLVEDRDAEVARLLDHLGLPHHPSCFRATGKVYVPRRNESRIAKADEPELVSRGFSRRDQWAGIDMAGFTRADRDILAAMWSRFGETLDF